MKILIQETYVFFQAIESLETRYEADGPGQSGPLWHIIIHTTGGKKHWKVFKEKEEVLAFTLRLLSDMAAWNRGDSTAT